MPKQMEIPAEETMTRFFDYIKQWVKGQPAQVAYVYNDHYTSYAKFWNEAQHFAKFLLQSGVQKGDRLAYIITPRPEFLIFYLASTMVGAIIVGIDINCEVEETAYILNHSNSSHILTICSHEDVNYQDYLTEVLKRSPGVEEVWIAGGSAELPNAITFQEIMQGDYSAYDQALQDRLEEISPEDGLVIAYATDANGGLQGNSLTQQDVITEGLIVKDEWLAPAGMQPGDHILLAGPLNHTVYAAELYAAPMIAGCTEYLFEEYDPIVSPQLIKKYAIDFIPGELVM